MNKWLRYVAQLTALAAVYILAARVGLALDAASGFAALVWPATGIALAAILLGGYRLAPGIFVGALIASLLSGSSPWVAAAIGVGNTLEAVAGTYLLRRIPGFDPRLTRVVDVLGFLFFGAVLSTMVSATIGVAALDAAGVVSAGQVGATWRVWWVGDLVGATQVAPLFLAWTRRARRPMALRDVAELAGAVAAGVVGCIFVFGGDPAQQRPLVQTYLVFPPMIWATLRFGIRGAVTGSFVGSIIAIWGTVTGHGPLATTPIHVGLFALQTFLGIAGSTFLLLGASVTERRRAEYQLRLAQAAAHEANRAKSEFLAVVSHELRTPLNAIAGYVELLQLGITGPTTDRQRDALQRIERNERHLLGLIDDLLSFARLEAGRLEMNMSAVSVRAVLDHVEAMIGPELRRRRHTFDYVPPDASVAVHADPEKLGQVVLNLLSNAAKFTPDGGRVELSTESDGAVVRLRVRDTGIGIPADQLERVFEPFVQVDRGQARRFPGAGLGLSIVRDLTRAMGGEVRLESRAGEGTTVTVALACAGESPPED